MRFKTLLKFGWFVFYTLIVFEVFSRIAFAIPYTSKRLSSYFEEGFWRRRWIENKKKQKDFSYSFDQFDPSTGWFSKPNLRDVTLWENKRLNTNHRGIRGTIDFQYEKPKDKIRILILGDSFTFGEGVSDDENWPYYLQTMLPNTEVINMGIHGFGHDQMLVLLKNEGIKYQPDIVIVGYLYEDMHRNLLSFRGYAKPKYKLKNDKLILSNYPVPSPEEILSRDWYRPRIIDVISFVRYRWTKSNGAFDRKMKEITKAILHEIASTSVEIGAIPVMVYLPYGKEINSIEEVTTNEDFFINACNENGNASLFFK